MSYRAGTITPLVIYDCISVPFGRRRYIIRIPPRREFIYSIIIAYDIGNAPRVRAYRGMHSHRSFPGHFRMRQRSPRLRIWQLIVAIILSLNNYSRIRARSTLPDLEKNILFMLSFNFYITLRIEISQNYFRSSEIKVPHRIRVGVVEIAEKKVTEGREKRSLKE